MRLLIFHLTQTILEPLPGSADPQCIHFLQILTIAVLAIVLTAPLGAIAVSLLGPVLLTKTEEEEELQSNENHHVTNGLFCTVKEVTYVSAFSTMSGNCILHTCIA